MKRVFIALLILAASAAFATTPNDSGVTVGNWLHSDNLRVSDLEDDNGFTVDTTTGYVLGFGDGDYAGPLAMFMGSADGWLADPNPINVTVIEDFSAEQLPSFGGNLYVTIFGAPSMDSDDAIMYAAPYGGPGDYTLEIVNVFGDIEEGDELSAMFFGIANFDSDGTYLTGLMMPVDKTFTVRFNAEKPETVVPEPATYAYALMGLGSVIGIKRRIKK